MPQATYFTNDQGVTMDTCGCIDPGHESEGCIDGSDCFCCCGHTEAQHTDDGCVGRG